MVGRDLQHRSV